MRILRVFLFFAAVMVACVFVAAPTSAQDQTSTKSTAGARFLALPRPYTVLTLAFNNEFKDFTAVPIDPKDPSKWTIEFSKVAEGPKATDYKAVMKRGDESAYYLIRDIKRDEGNSVVLSVEVSIPADQPYFMKK